MIEFGPIKFLVDQFMMPFLNMVYSSIYPNYGLAIILLTVLIKLLFFPLMQKQYHSMKMMQKLSPQMKEIRAKHKKDPKKMQQLIMELYKEHKVNPLQGCLPMVIQIPFFIAIYGTILSEGFREMIMQEGINPGLFSFWLKDLSAPDPTFILPILLAGFTFWSQKLVMVDPQQQKFLMFSPIIILFFGFKLASGVLLYWAVSTILSTWQQLWSMRQPDVIPAPVKETGSK